MSYVLAKHGLPHICGIGVDNDQWAARARIEGDTLTMETPLPRIYPEAWVLTNDGCWSLTKFQAESEGRIVGGLFVNELVSLGSRTMQAGECL